MERQTALNEKSQTILNTIARGKHDKHQIAEEMGVTLQVVNGGLNTLKRHGLVAIDDTGISLTEDAMGHLQVRKPRTGTKMEEARKVFAKYFSQGRAFVMEKLQNEVGLTPKGASTYFQSLRAANGLAHQRSTKSAGKTATKATGTKKPSMRKAKQTKAS